MPVRIMNITEEGKAEASRISSQAEYVRASNDGRALTHWAGMSSMGSCGLRWKLGSNVISLWHRMFKIEFTCHSGVTNPNLMWRSERTNRQPKPLNACRLSALLRALPQDSKAVISRLLKLLYGRAGAKCWLWCGKPAILDVHGHINPKDRKPYCPTVRFNYYLTSPHYQSTA